MTACCHCISQAGNHRQSGPGQPRGSAYIANSAILVYRQLTLCLCPWRLRASRPDHQSHWTCIHLRMSQPGLMQAENCGGVLCAQPVYLDGPGSPAHGWHCPQLAELSLITNQETATQTCLQADLMGSFCQMKLPAQMILTWVQLTKLINNGNNSLHHHRTFFPFKFEVTSIMKISVFKFHKLLKKQRSHQLTTLPLCSMFKGAFLL